MKTEVEVKFLDVDFEQVRAQLNKLGAVCEQPMRLMKRAIIDYSDHRLQTGLDAYVRVRDEGGYVTLTYKQFKELSVDGAREIETKVESFEDTVKIFEAVGLEVKSSQESKRETWKFGDVEIVLDEWPWLKPYIEIEGDTEEDLKNVAEKLGFDWSNAIFGDVMVAYRAQYPFLKKGDGRDVGSLSEVCFDKPLPEIFKK